MAKTVCFTIDVEPDFGGLIPVDVYFGKLGLNMLQAMAKKFGLRITAFATGKTLEDNPDVIVMLNNMNAEIEQHSYSHRIGHKTKLDDIQKGIETHRKLLGKNPLGYRAPQGMINRSELKLLERMGILFDSSIYPAYFPGRFNRLEFPTMPFRPLGSSLLEIPFSVIKKLRIPIGLSYMQLIGIGPFLKLLKIFGTSDLIIFDFHPYELVKVPSFSMLPLVPRLGYLRSQKMYDDPSSVFEKFTRFVVASGYSSRYLHEVYQEYEPKAPTLTWTGD